MPCLRKFLRNLGLSRTMESKSEATEYDLILLILNKLIERRLILIVQRINAMELFILFLLQQQGFCFGFVEFEEASSVQKALEVCRFGLENRSLY